MRHAAYPSRYYTNSPGISFPDLTPEFGSLATERKAYIVQQIYIIAFVDIFFSPTRAFHIYYCYSRW